jgi:tetratricopeptide (TPR) repeat protein
MHHNKIRYILQEVTTFHFWISTFRYFRGFVRLRKNPQGAIKDFEDLLKKGDLSNLEHLIYEHLVEAYAKAEKNQKARECFKKALSCGRKSTIHSSNIYQWLGWVYFKEKDFDQAMDCFKKAKFFCKVDSINLWAIDNKWLDEKIKWIENHLSFRSQNDTSLGNDV